MTRLAGFDGLRGLAVLAVVLFHGGVLRQGWIGVDLFFAISGYLITGILLDAKGSVGQILWPFYWRRALRLFPLAFLAALIVGVVTSAGWSTLWYVSYLVNWLPFPPAPRELGHYWTLALEEQFYLLWPLVVLLVAPGKSIKWLAALFVLGTIARAILILVPLPFASPSFLGNATIVRADPILIGCALALVVHGGVDIRKWRVPAIIALLMAAVGFAAMDFLKAHPWHAWAPKVAYVFAEPILALGFGAVLLLVLLHPPKWLQWKWLEHVGKISYGVYVIHGCISPWLYANVIDPYQRTVILLIMSLTLAEASWRFFEAPILSLKSRWPMPSTEDANPRARDADAPRRADQQREVLGEH